MTNSDDWDDELQQNGQQVGREWAHRSANRGELRRLLRFHESLRPDEERVLGVFQIMSIIDIGSENDPQGTREYWGKITGFRTDSDIWEPEFLLGFVEGSVQPHESEGTAHREPPPEDTSQDEEDSMEPKLRDEEYGKDYRSVDIDPPESGEQQ